MTLNLWKRLLALFTAAIILAACSSGRSNSQSASTLSTSTLPKPSISISEIRNAYITLFDLSNSAITPKVKVTQDGTQLQAAMKTAFGSSLSKAAGSATVVSVSLESKQACLIADVTYPCAEVTYNLLTPTGSPIFTTPSTGYAVYSGQKWLVAKNTVCSLLTLANNNKAPKGC